MAEFPRQAGERKYGLVAQESADHYTRSHRLGMSRLWELLLPWLQVGVLDSSRHQQLNDAYERDLDQQTDSDELGDRRVYLLIYQWCHDGTLTVEQVKEVCEAYNGVPCTHSHSV